MQSLSRTTLTVVLLSLAFAALACADTIYVCWDGSADYLTIQEGIDAASSGDDVVVRPGTYNEAIDFNGNAITVRSLDGPHSTIIDAAGLSTTAVRCINEEGAGTMLMGFTITHGGPGCCGNGGGGMYNEASSPTVVNCIFRENTASNGAGMSNYADNANPANPTLINCVFYANHATGGVSDPGGGMLNFDSSPTLINCTFHANVADDVGGAIANGGDSAPVLRNCILWGNSAPQGSQIWGGTPDVAYSDIQGAWPGEGNIDTDPLFVDGSAEDMHLQPASPCIDAGDNTAVPIEITTDLDGNPRIAGGVVDMGAFESQATTQLVEIDIKPGSYPNSINLGSHGLVPAAILSSDSFDATAVDPASVTLAGAGAAVRGNGKHDMVHTQDVNGDGLMDLVIQVETENLNPDEFQDGYAILAGETFDGVLFEGFDEIRIVPD